MLANLDKQRISAHDHGLHMKKQRTIHMSWTRGPLIGINGKADSRSILLNAVFPSLCVSAHIYGPSYTGIVANRRLHQVGNEQPVSHALSTKRPRVVLLLHQIRPAGLN